MAFKALVLLSLSLVAMAFAQRAGFAGTRPIGYPSIVSNSAAASENGLGNKFGEDDTNSPTTTQRLPIEARGDRDLINRISKLPIDQQPFWYINWQALEAQRQKPQTWPHKPNSFIDSQSNRLQF